MLFNSISFAVFLPIIFALYWLAYRNLQIQNPCLFIASCYFYASWDYRFLFLLMFSISLDYFTGLMMGSTRNRKKRRYWFIGSVSINLGFLGLFKYYNFFAE